MYITTKAVMMTSLCAIYADASCQVRNPYVRYRDGEALDPVWYWYTGYERLEVDNNRVTVMFIDTQERKVVDASRVRDTPEGCCCDSSDESPSICGCTISDPTAPAKGPVHHVVVLEEEDSESSSISDSSSTSSSVPSRDSNSGSSSAATDVPIQHNLLPAAANPSALPAAANLKTYKCYDGSEIPEHKYCQLRNGEKSQTWRNGYKITGSCPDSAFVMIKELETDNYGKLTGYWTESRKAKANLLRPKPAKCTCGSASICRCSTRRRLVTMERLMDQIRQARSRSSRQ